MTLIKPVTSPPLPHLKQHWISSKIGGSESFWGHGINPKPIKNCYQEHNPHNPHVTPYSEGEWATPSFFTFYKWLSGSCKAMCSSLQKLILLWALWGIRYPLYLTRYYITFWKCAFRGFIRCQTWSFDTISSFKPRRLKFKMAEIKIHMLILVKLLTKVRHLNQSCPKSIQSRNSRPG